MAGFADLASADRGQIPPPSATLAAAVITNRCVFIVVPPGQIAAPEHGNAPGAAAVVR